MEFGHDNDDVKTERTPDTGAQQVRPDLAADKLVNFTDICSFGKAGTQLTETAELRDPAVRSRHAVTPER